MRGLRPPSSYYYNYIYYYYFIIIIIINIIIIIIIIVKVKFYFRKLFSTKIKSFSLAPWQRIQGALRQIDTGLSDSVWGTSRDQRVWKLRRSGKGWRNIRGRMWHVACGEGGTWAVKRNHRIFYRERKKSYLPLHL